MRIKKTFWLIAGILLSTSFLALSAGEAGKTASPPDTGAEVQSEQGQASTAEADLGEKVNINTAGIDRLTAVPGIGAKTAERIKQYREENGGFSRLEDLKKVKGIGSKNFEKIKPHITM